MQTAWAVEFFASVTSIFSYNGTPRQPLSLTSVFLCPSHISFPFIAALTDCPLMLPRQLPFRQERGLDHVIFITTNDMLVGQISLHV